MDYLTNDTELTAVADAIREKSDTTDSLEWPDGFIQAIEDCETGGPELEWLWGNQITNTLSGTVDSTDDAYAGPILDLVVDGVSTQVSYTGKNLFDKSTAVVSNYINSAGNAAAASGNTRTDFIPITGGGQYAFSYGAALASGNYIAWYTDADQSTVTGNRTDARGLTSVIVTAPSDANYVRFSFQNDVLSKVQLEVGSTATTYEPYVGGKPSPNPDYPQDILSVDALTLHANGTSGVTWWNQLLDGRNTGSWSNTGNMTMTYDSTAKSTKLTSTTDTNASKYTRTQTILSKGHVYIYKAFVDATHATLPAQISIGTNIVDDVTGGSARYAAVIASQSQASNSYVYQSLKQTEPSGGYAVFSDVQLFDLTAMFGAGNEPSTVAEFEAMFPEPYYPYDAGSWLDSGDWPISLYDGTLCSLPNGTKDELHLTYLKPSKDHEGWAWYDRELVSRCAAATFDGTDMTGWILTNGTNPFWSWNQVGFITGATVDSFTILSNNNSRCSAGKVVTIGAGSANLGYFNTNFSMRFRPVVTTYQTVTVDDLATYFTEHPTTFVLPMQEPVTTQLDPIELPIMPSENATVWCDGGSAQPTFMLEYIQNANIVISRLEDSIADLATS